MMHVRCLPILPQQKKSEPVLDCRLYTKEKKMMKSFGNSSAVATGFVLGTLIRNKAICEVRQTQHQNPEFGHTQGEIQKTPAKKYISIQGTEGGQGGETQKTINFGGKLSFILSFLVPARLHCCYIYFHCSYLYNYNN
jgi:hypothetical protein